MSSTRETDIGAKDTPDSDVISDACFLWHELANLRFEIAAAVDWIRADAEPSIALARLDAAADKALVGLRQLERFYALGASDGPDR